MFSANTAFNSYGSHGHGGYSGYNSSSISTANISYDTNSKDPILLRARVFVGNLNPKIGREEIIQLFRSYGTLLGVTVFKGYAFVQFSHGSEADMAVNGLNGYNWMNNILDVKLAVSGQQPMPIQAYQKPASHLAGAVAATAKGMGKRIQTHNVHPLQNKDQQKRIKVDQVGGGAAQHQQEKNKTYATNFNSNELANIQNHDACDTLICGTCRYVTSDLADFIEHRKQPCKLGKADGEPDALQCASCNEEFLTSWALLSHIGTAHNNPLYKDVFYPKSGENGAQDGVTSEDNKPAELDVSMEQK